MKHLLALDIGHRNIKVVYAKKRFGSYKVVGYKLVPCGGGQDPAALVAATLAELELPSDTNITLLLPRQLVTMRRLSVPFTDPKQIEQTIKYEIEPHVPYNIEDMIVDSYITESKLNSSTIMAIAVTKKNIEKYLSYFANLAFAPSTIITEDLGLWRYLSATGQIAEAGTLSIHLGSCKTVLSYFKDGILIYSRNLMQGGDTVDQAIAQNAAIPYTQAERVKLELSNFGAGSASDPMASSDRKKAAVNESVVDFWIALKKEILRSLRSTAEQYGTELIPKKIILSGGGSQIKGLENYISELFEIPATRITLAEKLPGLAMGALKEDPNGHLFCAVIGALQGLIKGSKPEQNLLKEELAPGGLISPLVKETVKYTLLLMLLSLGLIINTRIGLAQAQVQLGACKDQVEQIYRNLFPESHSKIRGKERVVLQEKLGTQEQKLAKMRKDLDLAVPVLDIHRQISRSIPKELGVLIRKTTISASDVHISGSTSTYNKVEQIRNNLNRRKIFSRVSLDSVKTGRNNQVEFSIKIKMKGWS